MLISRRKVLKGMSVAGLGAAGLPLAAPAISQGATKVSFTTSWIPEGPNLFAYIARDKGFWKKAGLDVSVARGSGSGAAAQAVSAGTFDFGMAATPTVIVQVAKKLPITCIGQINYDALMGIGLLADSPIRKPKDLEGKKFAATTKSGEFPFLPAFAANAGVDLSKVEILQVDPNVRQRLLIEKQVSAISAFAPSVVPGYIANGFSPKIILFSKFNLPLYGNALFTQQALLEKEPELCGAIASGLNEATKFVLLKPEQSLDIFFKANPEMELAKDARAQTKLALDFFRYSVVHEAAKKNAIGYAPPDDYKTMTDLVMKYVAPDGKRPDLDKAVSNKFAGPVKLSDAEWSGVPASLADVSKLLT